MSDLSILKDCVAVHFELSQWSGGKTIRVEELDPALAGKLPPQQVARAGSFQLISNESLRPFNRIKRSVIRMLDGIGVRFMSGWAIPKSKSSYARAVIEEAIRDTDLEKERFSERFREEVDDWLSQWGQWGDAVRRFVPDESYVASRFNVNYGLYAVGLASEDENDPANAALLSTVANLGDTLFEEVAQSSASLFDDSFSGKDKVGQKAVSAFVKILDKLEGMQMATPLAAPLVAQVQATLSNLPKKGYVENRELAELCSAILLLADADRAKAHAEKLLAGNAPSIYSSVSSSVQGIAWGEIDPSYDPNALANEPAQVGLSQAPVANATQASADWEDDTPFEAAQPLSAPVPVAQEQIPSPIPVSETAPAQAEDWTAFAEPVNANTAPVESTPPVEAPAPIEEEATPQPPLAQPAQGLVTPQPPEEEDEPEPTGPVSVEPFAY